MGNPTVRAELGHITVTGLNPYTPLDATGTLLRIQGSVAPLAQGTTDIHITRFELAERTEPKLSPGPQTLTITGSPCFDAAAYSSALETWSVTPGQNILGILAILDCLNP